MARFGSVRTPSKTLELHWGDIDWGQNRFTVTSPKTNKQGKPWRIVPLFPELREILAEAFDLASDRAEFVITRYRNDNVQTQFNQILKRAGVDTVAEVFPKSQVEPANGTDCPFSLARRLRLDRQFGPIADKHTTCKLPMTTTPTQ